MGSDFGETLAAWNGFYGSVAAVAATLIGLLFVALALNPNYDRARYNLAQLNDTQMSLRVTPSASSSAAMAAAPAAAEATAPARIAVQSTPNVASLSTASSGSSTTASPTPTKAADTRVAEAPLSLNPSVTLAGISVEVLNGNGITQVNTAYGPSLLQPQSILNPRLIRFNVRVAF